MLNKKIVVVCGGISTEREVSLKSGKAVYEGLQRFGYQNIELFDLKQDNISSLINLNPDVVYLALHGKGGEDGCIQGMLELAGIPYTGPGVASSAVCMNKIFTKQVIASAGLPTGKFSVKYRAQCKDYDEIAKQLIEEIGLPMVLKSPCQGSSIGVIIVKKESDMIGAIKEIFTYGDDLMAEEFLKGTEITLPILGNEKLDILPDVEITSEREFYDYKAKYTSGLCNHIIPARITEKDREKVKEIGEKAYRILNCCGLSRIDFIIDEKQGPMLIEVNTLPGMTEMSLFPDSARAAGISFDKLVSVILELGYNTKREIKAN